MLALREVDTMTTLTLLDLIAMPRDTSVLFRVIDYQGTHHYGHWHAGCVAEYIRRWGMDKGDGIVPYKPGLSQHTTPQCCLFEGYPYE